MPDSYTSVEEALELTSGMFPAIGGRKSKALHAEDLIEEWGELTEAHAERFGEHVESGAVMGVRNPDLKAIRHTHHRLAQLLAVGTDETVAAKLCNYSVMRVSQLKGDPAFAELLAHYASNVEEQWADFVGTASGLSMDFLQELQSRLDEKPETLTATHLLEAIKLLADRTGHAPVQKSVNVNVNQDLGARLQAARERIRNVTP